MGICYLVGAGDFVGSFKPGCDDLVIAADGGYDSLITSGIRCDVLVGDLDSIKEKASAIVRSEGFDQSVTVEIGRESYPTRKYGALSFPAGNYLSLKIMIGDATGQNWWCVLFPPLCLSAAEDTDEAISVGFTGEEYKIITHTNETTYKIRFKILETIEEAIGD